MSNEKIKFDMLHDYMIYYKCGGKAMKILMLNDYMDSPTAHWRGAQVQTKRLTKEYYRELLEVKR